MWPRRAAELGCLLLMAAHCGGCGAATLAFQGATFAGVSVGSAVTGHDATEDEEDTAERCDALAATPPYMGELIHSGNGGEAVRGLILGDAGGKPKWFLSSTVTNLASLQFTPPISASAGDPKKRNFLAYTAAQPQNDRESNQLIAFLASFESGPGVLSISGCNYRKTAMLSTRTVTEPAPRARAEAHKFSQSILAGRALIPKRA